MVDRCLDLELSNKIASFIKDLTTSGSPSLNAEKMKGLKKICRTSDLYVEYAFHLLMTQLTEEHSEIRLSAFQIIDELFSRSHVFRELLVSDFQNFLELTVEIDQNQPLPPPRGAAVKLRSDTLKAIQQWQDKFGGAYKKLLLGYNYLKSCKHIDFNDIRARSQAEKRRFELQEERKRKALAAKLDKVWKEISEQRKDIEDAAMEAENCLELLVPKPDSLLFCKSDFYVGPDHNSANMKMPPDLVTSSADPVSLVPQCSEQCPAETGKDSEGKLTENSCAYVELTEKDFGKGHIPLHQIELASGDRDDVSVEERQGKVTENAAHQSDKVHSFSKKLQEKLDNTKFSQNKADGEPSTFADTHQQVSENNNTGDNRDTDEDEDDDDGDEEFEEENETEKRMVQAHGLGTRKYNLEIEIGTDKIHLVETEDNRDLYQSLKDAACLISMRYLPQIVKWLEVLSKAGADQSQIKAMINLKVRLEAIRAKCTELQVVGAETTSKRQESDSDDEFVEVPEKEGYEPIIPSHLRAEYGLDGVPSESDVQMIKKTQSVVDRTRKTKKPEKKLDQPGAELKVPASVGEGAGNKYKPTSLSWSLSERNSSGSSEDPTSRAANLVKLGLKVDFAGRPSLSKKKPSSTITSGEASDIPELPFGPDLEHWGQLEKIEAPTVIKNDSLHRFWRPAQVETEKPSQMEVAAVVNRTFHYVGDFVPVKWKCRAKLPSGKLCERMDRVKCPFHGKIIPRDKNGQPSDPKDVKNDAPGKSVGASETCEPPPWLDSELQADIEAATGHDLGSERSKAKNRKGPKEKGKAKKYPGLTDIGETKNTSRARLEAKVFNRSALKRVAGRLDAADYKRLRDKFGNQFNYAHKE